MYAEPLGDLGKSFFKKIRKIIPKPIKKLAILSTAPISILTPGGRKVIGKATPKPILKVAKGGLRIAAGITTAGASEILYAKRRAEIKKKKKDAEEARLAPIRQEAALRAAIEQDKLENEMEDKEEQEKIDSDPVNRIKSVLSSVPPPYLFIGGMVVVGMLLSRR